MHFRLRIVLTILATALAAGCSLHSATPGFRQELLPAGAIASASASGSKIQHVVIVVQENRSFDNFFAKFPGADGARFGLMHDGTRIKLRKVGLRLKLDLCHQYSCFRTEWDHGRMDAFDLGWYAVPSAPLLGTYPYQYVDPAQIAPYWTMARQYVLADHMFQTQGSGSFTSHQDLIAGDATLNRFESIADAPWYGLPWGCDGPAEQRSPILRRDGVYKAAGGPFPCYSYETLRDRLDAAKLSWKYYTPPMTKSGQVWNAFDAIKAVRYGPEWKSNISSPTTNVLRDAKKGTLPAVSWVIPIYENSDHPNSSGNGPSWVASIVNAVGKGPDWNSTAIIIVWDDWGGLYDHVPPPQIDYTSLGFRVPMLVVSPYARKSYVSHTQYEFASILKFIEQNWGLPSLHRADERATSISDCFDFSQPPRKFTPIPAPHSAAFFFKQKPSGHAIDTE